MPKRDRYVWVCTNRRPDGHPKGSCAERGAVELQLALKAAVASAGLAGRVRVMNGSCQDLCWVGAVAAVMPDDAFLKQLSEADLPLVIDALSRSENVGLDPSLRAAGKVCSREDFDDPGPLVSLAKKPSPARSGGGT